MKTTAPLFEIEDRVVARPLRRVAPIAVEASEDNVTGVAGIALVGELLDRLGVVEVADRHHLRPIGPGGYSGGECYRPHRRTPARRWRLPLGPDLLSW